MKRFKHNLSHYRLCDANMGKLYPIGCMEVLPGDSFRQQTTALVRMATLVTPVMHPVSVRIHHWFVPNRLVWSGWEDFITGKTPGTLPTVANSATVGTLLDYLGVAPAASGNMNALPVRAFNLIWNEFYRDQDLSAVRAEDTLTVPLVSWGKDYFTTARAAPQQGSAVVVSGLAGMAPVKGIGIEASAAYTQTPTVHETGGVTRAYSGGAEPAHISTVGQRTLIEQDPANAGFPGIFADLTGAVDIDVEDIRRGFALQRFAEARNRYGSRYTDYLRYLGIRASDARLQRPEFLGGGSQVVSFSEVLATAESTSVNVGDQFGHGIAAIRTRPYRRFFEEHGFVLSLLSVRPKTVYMDQVPKPFLRSDSEDFWQKEYEAMGDQPVTNQEVYSAAAAPTDVFGYVQRFREYREQVSGVSGEFRTTYADWHFARDFTAQPTLNETFVACNPDLRPFAAQAESQMFVMAAHSVAARRLVARRARV